MPGPELTFRVEFKVLIIIRLDLEFYQNKGGVIAESYSLWLKSCAKSLLITLAGTPSEKLERKYSELSNFHKI